MKVKVVEFSSDWKKDFENEKAVLAVVLHGIEYELHHIGSTAIEGVAARPIIDMLLLVHDLDELDTRRSEIAVANYECLGEYGVSGRRYFRKLSEDGVVTHRMQAFLRSSDEAVRHLAFRDYLTYNRNAALQYSRLKSELAMANPYNLDAYNRGKDPFIKRVENEAVEWYENGKPTK